MESKLTPFFCYLDNGMPEIREVEPDDFARLPFSFTALCPNSEIARLTYQTNLRIMAWRFPETCQDRLFILR